MSLYNLGVKQWLIVAIEGKMSLVAPVCQLINDTLIKLIVKGEDSKQTLENLAQKGYYAYMDIDENNNGVMTNFDGSEMKFKLYPDEMMADYGGFKYDIEYADNVFVLKAKDGSEYLAFQYGDLAKEVH